MAEALEAKPLLVQPGVQPKRNQRATRKPQKEPESCITFKRVGDVYQIGEGFFSAHYKGAGYYAEILSLAPESVSCTELVWGYGSYAVSKKEAPEEAERCRQLVKKALDRFYDVIRFDERSRDIAKHLSQYVRTGKDCQYLGPWNWDL